MAKTDNSAGNAFLYSARGAACIMVVFIHCVFPARAGEIVMAAARFAVPLFFAMSGYFFIDPDTFSCPDRSVRKEKIRKAAAVRIKKLLPALAAVWCIYTVYACVYEVLSGGSLKSLWAQKLAPAEIVRLIVFNSGRLVWDPVYIYDFMWFLFAMLYIYALVYVFAGKMPAAALPVCILLMCGLYTGYLCQIVYPFRFMGIGITTWYVLRNWLFVGLPFFLLGFNIRHLLKGAGSKYTVLFILMIPLGILMEIMEYLKAGNHDIYFGSLLTAAGIMLSGKYIGNIRIPLLYEAGKKHAAFVYYYHVLIYSLWIRIFAYFYLKALPGMRDGAVRFWNEVYPYLLPVVILLLTLMLSAAYGKLHGKKIDNSGE